MFTIIIWIGTVFGFLAGIVHAVDIYRQQMARPERDGLSLALYRGIWALALWTLFGFYLVVIVINIVQFRSSFCL